MNIIQAITDENLFRPFLAGNGSLKTWQPWLTALRVIYGLPIKPKHHELIRACTGRDPLKLPSDGFDTAVMLCGRHCGKSRIASVIGSFEAALAGHEDRLAAGESGLVAVLSPTKRQSQNIKKYMRTLMDSTPMLRATVVRETRMGFELSNGIVVEIQPGDFRAIRGASILCGLIDEACFFGVEDDTVKSDTELIRAIQPKVMAVGGRLLIVSSKYAMRGWCYDQWKKHWGQDDSSTLVWSPAGSRVMNPTLKQSVIDRAMAEDPAMARSELLNEWREDVDSYVSRAMVERLVVKGRTRLFPYPGQHYHAFVDLSGGISEKSDDAALAIAHVENGIVVLDLLERYRPPFSPYAVIRQMVDTLRQYGLTSVTGDRFSPGFVAQTFAGHRIRYQQATADKGTLYADLLPRLGSGTVAILDDELLLSQLCSLERRTRSGGKDVIDHPRGQHDDLANVLAGVVHLAARPVITVGALPGGKNYRSLSNLMTQYGD
jgi:hypothetical protein